MGDLSIGTSVDARFKTNGAFYPGKIKQMNTDDGHLMTATKEKIHVHTIKEKLNIYIQLTNYQTNIFIIISLYVFIICIYYICLIHTLVFLVFELL